MRLQDVCTVFSDGDWIESKDQSDKGIRLVQTGNIGEGLYLEKEERAKYVSEETFESLKCTEIYPGDILISRLPEPVGRACIIPPKKERMITAVDCTICRVDESIVSKEYLCYFMRSNAYYTKLLGSVTGTTRKRISRKNLGNIELEIPPKEEQTDVVSQLERLINVINSRNKELQLLDDIIKARFVEMFGDPRTNSKGFETKNGSELFKISNGKAVPNNKRFEEGIPAYGGNGISWYTDDALCDKDTIVIGRVGFQSGNVHLVKGPVWITDNAMYISDFYDDNLSLVFLCEMMEQIDFTKHQDAGDLKKVTQKPFMEMKYIIPSKELQSEYMDFVIQVYKSKLKE